MSGKQGFNEFHRKSNPAQRAVVAVLVPVCIVVVAYGLMHYAYWNTSSSWNPTNLGKSWVGWLVALLAIGVFEYVWLKDK